MKDEVADFQGDGCGNSRHAIKVLCWNPLKVGPEWAGLFSSTCQAPGKLPNRGVAREAGDAVGAQTRSIHVGCFNVIVFVVRVTQGAEAELQNRDRYEQTQQEDKLQKIHNLHFDPLNRFLDRQWVIDNEE